MKGKYLRKIGGVALTALMLFGIAFVSTSEIQAQNRRRVIIVRPYPYRIYRPFGFGYRSWWGYPYGYDPYYGNSPYYGQQQGYGNNSQLGNAATGAAVGAAGGAIAGAVIPGVSTGEGAIAGAILGGVLGATVNGRQYYRDTRGYCYYVDQYGQPHYNYNVRC